jgi:asparagine synthase (glutamine-hydrolysing)
MYTSLEARVPLLDHNIVEFAVNLDSDFKIKKGIQKYILKEVLYDYIPKSIMERPKWGFTFPVSKWLKTDLYFLIEKYLNNEILTELNIYNVDIVRNYIIRYLNGEDYLWNRIWSLIILNKFLIKHNEE